MKYLARILYLYQTHRWRAVRPPEKATKVVCISDTHNTQPSIPHGDLLIHAGDLTQSGSSEEIQAALTWLQSLSHPHKIGIAGNHDISLDSDDSSNFKWGDVKYLHDNRTSIDFSNGRCLNVFGSPWTPAPGTCAFQHPRNKDVWTGRIPDDTDILVSHMPPRFHLDIAGFGDENLLKELWRTRQGFFALFRMVFRWIAFVWRPRGTRGIVLVNVAAVGGFRETERRSPTLVWI